MNEYCKLANGKLVSMQKVDAALNLIAELKQGFTVVNLNDSELFTKGDKLDAIRHFMSKHHVGLVEAKEAIEHLRGEK